MERAAFVVYVDLDRVPGTMHSKDSARKVIGGILMNHIPHYHPMVSVAPAELQPPSEIKK